MADQTIQNDEEKLKTDLETRKVEIETYAMQIKSQVDQIIKSQSAAEGSLSKISELKGASENEFKNITEIKNQLIQKRQDIDSLVSELNGQKVKVENSVKDTDQKISAIETYFKKIEEMKKGSEAAKNFIDDYLNKSNENQKKIEAIGSSVAKQNTDLQTKFSETDSKANEINSKNDEIRGRYNEILDVYKKLLNDEKDKEGKIIKRSIYSEIIELYNDFKSRCEQIDLFSEEQKKNFTGLYSELNNKILTLLPSAGAAGLASTYFQAKGRYSYVGEQVRVTGKTNPSKKVWVFLSKSIATWINYFLFITPLLGWICLIYPPFLKALNLEEFAQSMAIPVPITWEWLATRFLFGAPFFLLSFFGWQSIRLNRRLYEEYNHKQRVMELYHSFQNEVAKTSDENLKTKLLNIMLDTVQDKPSAIMNKYDEHPIDKLKSKLSVKESLIHAVGQ